ncbi:MAG: hypothetical protein E7773_08045 [Sphingomonas sp.]|uniref:class I SAM-dependent methyltransferase n=1 Tax=Sphingomonas sp. TaxID=28214 RepID=UPI001220B257|nr:hypothetical protein [Sphingomonas sp.]THD35891.1 MAG: hypothetical protein E7773_08045 [Sphingomonas sp.]
MSTLRGALARAKRYVLDPVARSELVTRVRFAREVHQDVTLSQRDRYPLLFGTARDLLADVPAPTILSFGCSAGEEVLSLQDYIPGATIVGAELNRARLRQCRRLPPHPNRIFVESTAATIAAHGPYDAIFCMAVLTRRPHTVEAENWRSIRDFYPFDRFAGTLGFLASHLRAGGLLVVEHTLYRVEDVAGLPLRAVTGPGTYPAKGPRFDPAGDRIEPQPVVSRVFRKVADTG